MAKKKRERPPCPHCGAPLATAQAQQCLKCGADWHDREEAVQQGCSEDSSPSAALEREANDKHDVSGAVQTSVVRHTARTKWLTFLACFGLLIVPIRYYSGIVGPELLQPEQIVSKQGKCSFHTCQREATGKHRVAVYDGKEEDRYRKTTFYVERHIKLCDRHARSAMNGRWPEGNQLQTWLNTLTFAAIVGGIVAFVALRYIVKPKPRTEEAR